MNTAKQELLKLINEISDNQISEVIDFVTFLKMKREKEMLKNLERASESSLSFWDNDIDDEVWNNV
ncbi:DUF2281 domain-containing protein [Herbivorax sp. ANBcel31]|uniref:DUF2281 domain-containing protein n=1 Tax=Herbivorax sp. ANBcel31 TaxID=3069754 RepID=UPI0027AE34D3|nr:DUF2281 domain-containing protein [Herbivorax sp. ANBcel31]MDQ2088222.1 DUF2281 domain-containing protein [Herbivorax sp. ANBcel31]